MGNWQKQTGDKPLFEDLIWSRPQNKRQAGKLVIIGGQAQEFAHVAAAHAAAQKAGAGSIKTVLPDSLNKLAGMIPGVQLAPANQSGSFAQNALAELLDAAEWADAVLLAGDFGRSSETTAMLDNFLAKNHKPLTIAGQALPSVGLGLDELAKLESNLILSFADLQKLGSALRVKKPFVSTMSNQAMADLLQEISQNCAANIIAVSDGQAWVAVQGKVTSTRLAPDLIELSAYCAVWHMQNPAKPLEALATACYQLAKS